MTSRDRRTPRSLPLSLPWSRFAAVPAASRAPRRISPLFLLASAFLLGTLAFALAGIVSAL